MAKKAKQIKGSTIPYQLRPHKAIERNLFLSLLRKLDRVNGIDLEKYRYVGFGAAFLEDFKALHSEFGIDKMDCIESDFSAYTRQLFNNPYYFIKLYNVKSTDYITSRDFKEDINQIIWWDYTSPGQLRESLNDIELTAQKVGNFDILKFTFNSAISAFIDNHAKDWAKMEFVVEGWSKMQNDHKVNDFKQILSFMESDNILKKYLPETIVSNDIKNDFSEILRALAVRAVRRGLSKGDNKLDFYHLSSFSYADGQAMTTITGIICRKVELPRIIAESGLKGWEFYHPDTKNELIPSSYIQVPVMTGLERIEIDKKIHNQKPKALATGLKFKYADTSDDHCELIEGYCKFYRYLPHYSKIITS